MSKAVYNRFLELVEECSIGDAHDGHPPRQTEADADAESLRQMLADLERNPRPLTLLPEMKATRHDESLITRVVDEVMRRLRESVPSEVRGLCGEAVTLDEAAVCALLDRLHEDAYAGARMKVQRLRKDGGNLLVFTMPRRATLDDRVQLHDDVAAFCNRLTAAGFATWFVVLADGVTLDVLHLKGNATSTGEG